MSKKSGSGQGQPTLDKNSGFDDEANRVRIAKGVWIYDDVPQQNQQDGELTRQAGDDLQTTAQPG